MNKILSITAKILAGAVLVGALVYYNFIDKVKIVEGVEIGNACPDFMVQTIVNNDGTFEMGEKDYCFSEGSGKVRVINFWATWCSGCIQELPEFSEFAAEYPEVEVIAICGASGDSATVLNWMNNKGWTSFDKKGSEWLNFSLTFGYYGTDRNVYQDLGGKGTWPTTIIVDQEGVIVERKNDTMSLDELKAVVLPLLAE